MNRLHQEFCTLYVETDLRVMTLETGTDVNEASSL